MASTFAVSESYGTSGSQTTADTTAINLLSTNTASGSDTTTNTAAAPITIPAASNAYSYERYIRGHWTGTFTSISSVTFWKKSGTLGTGVTINAASKGNQTYATPVNTASSIATAAIPTTQGAGLTPAYSTAFSDYVVLQLVVASTASSGNIGTITYTFGWNEV